MPQNYQDNPNYKKKKKKNKIQSLAKVAIQLYVKHSVFLNYYLFTYCIIYSYYQYSYYCYYFISLLFFRK